MVQSALARLLCSLPILKYPQINSFSMTLQFINQPLCVILSMVPTVLFRETLWIHRQICLCWVLNAAKNAVGFSMQFFPAFFKQSTVVCDARLAKEQRPLYFVVRIRFFYYLLIHLKKCILFLLYYLSPPPQKSIILIISMKAFPSLWSPRCETAISFVLKMFSTMSLLEEIHSS